MDQQRDAASPVLIFYSCAQEDQRFLDRLKKHLGPMRQEEIINDWDDYHITSGTDQLQARNEALVRASVFLLLLSPDFFASDSCCMEMKCALERHQDGAYVIPILLRYIDWHDTPIASLQCLPRDGTPIAERKSQDEVFYLIAQEIRSIVKTLHSSPNRTQLASRSHPRNYISHPRNALFQPRPGEFEQLEATLFQSDRNGSPLRLGLIGSTEKIGMIGMGGIGKTQLAVQVAYRYEERFASGVFWTTATGLDLLAWQRHFATLALRTEYLPPNDNPSRSDNEYRRACHFCRYLAQHADILLILDNVEDPNMILTVLPELAGREVTCTILYTSRNRSLLPGMAHYVVERLPEQAALRLLLETSRSALLDEVLAGSTQPEPWSAYALCRDVDCLPLALVHLRGLLVQDQSLTLGSLLEALRRRGALELAKTRYGDAGPLFATFFLSWEKVDSVAARQLFKLAAFFPEAVPIPLWLLGFAGGLGEDPGMLGPLREACLLLQALSLFEEMSNDQVQLHPLLREFGRRLVQEEDYGKELLREAAERLAAEFASLHKLQKRASHTSYRHCLEQVRAAQAYAVLLGAYHAMQIERIEQWMDRESSLLEDEALWPKTLPGLFYQQLSNRAREEGVPIEDMAPRCWVRLLEPVEADDTLLLTVFRGHTDRVRSVAFSPDSSQIVTGSLDGTACIWERANRRLLATFLHTSAVSSVAFSPDSSQILTGSLDGTARIWERVSRRLLTLIESHSSTVTSVAFSPDGTQVLTGSGDGTACLCKGTSGETLFRLRGHRESASVLSVAFSPDGSQIVTGSSDGTACLWAAPNGKLLMRWRVSRVAVTGVAFSNDGRYLLTSSYDRTITVWERADGIAITSAPDQRKEASSLAQPSDSVRIPTVSDGEAARLWDRSSGAFEVEAQKSGNELSVTSLQTYAEEAFFLAHLPDNMRIPTASGDQAVQLWDRSSGAFEVETQNLDSGKPVTSMQGSTEEASSPVNLPDNARMPTASHEKAMHLWDRWSATFDSPVEVQKVGTGKLVTSMQGHTEEVLCLACSPDGSQVLTGSDDKTARLWDLHTGALLTILSGHTRSVWSVAFSPDGKYMMTGSDDQTVRLWRSYKGKLSSRDEGHTGRISSMAFSSDGNLLVTGAWDHTARVWERSTGKLLSRLSVQDPLQDPPQVNSVTFSPDATRLIVSSDNNTATIWETKGGKMLAALQHKHQDRKVNSVAFSPDGTHVLTASEVIRLWDSSTYQPVLTFPVSASTVGFSPDGRCIFGMSWNESYIWERSSGTLLRTLKTRSPTEGIERRATFSPDGRELLTIGDEGRVSVWNIRDGRLLRVLEVPTENVMHVSFSPSGRLILTCDSQGRVFFWGHDAATEDRLLGMYGASCELGASYWMSNDEVLLADKSARPRYHRLKLEGMQ